jgi:formylglycine-generating enzyme required for sulfatase activity
VNAGACNQGPVDGAGGDNGWGRGSRPIIEVDWNDAAAYAIFVRGRAGGAGYRLPTEAEWEYAARVGTGTRWSFGDAESQLGAYAWFSNNLNSRTQPVGGKAPNPWGLFDMHGNVWEWVEDCYVNSNSGFATNGSANTT